MNFFLDFEGTQFSHEIISIGIVAEDGDHYYSTVSPKKEKVNKFITKLTGLTQEEVAAGPSVDEVFKYLYYWITQKTGSSIPKFYVYGCGDVDFIKHTINNCSNHLANTCLCLMLGNICDYSAIIIKKLKLQNPIGLAKIVSAFRGKEIEQDHNALQDAYLLKELVDNIDDNKTLKTPINKKYYTEKTKHPQRKTINTPPEDGWVYVGCGQMFKSLREATNYIYKYRLNLAHQQTANKNNIAKRIKKSIENKEEYFGSIWKKERVGNNE